MLVFRSILVPLTATLGFLLTVGADVRRGRRGVPVGLACRPVRRRATGRDHQPHADLPDRRRVRPRHGLPGVPGHPDARGARARRDAGRRRDRRASGTAPAWSRPPRSS